MEYWYVSLLRKYAFTISVVVTTLVTQILTRLTGFAPDAAHFSYSNAAPLQDSEVLITLNTILIQFVGLINYVLFPSSYGSGLGADIEFLYILIVIFIFLVTLLKLAVSFGFILLLQKVLNSLYPNYPMKTIFYGFVVLLVSNQIAEFFFIDSLSLHMLTQCFEFGCFNYLLK